MEGMEEIKASRKYFSKLGWSLAIGTILIQVAQAIPVALVKLLRPEWLENPNTVLHLSALPMYLVGMPLLILLIKRVPAGRVEKHTMTAGRFAVAVIMCFGLVYASNILGNILTLIIGLLKGGGVQNIIADVALSTDMIWILVYMVLVAPVMEEYIFRKLLVDRTVRYGQGVAILTSALTFGLFHGNLNQFAYAFVLGLFLAYLYVRTGNIKITIALHMMVNFVGGFVSALVMKLIDLEGYMEVTSSGDAAAVMAYYKENAASFTIYGVYLLFVFGMLIAGTVLTIVFLAKKRFPLAKGEVVLPKEKKFSTVILNAGMIVFCVIWIAMIVWQLFI